MITSKNIHINLWINKDYHHMKSHITLTYEPLNLDYYVSQASDPSCGAISVFIGTTRDNFDGKRVVRLEYEAYAPMAERKINKIIEEASKLWPLHSAIVAHRLGHVPTTEASIIIVCSSSHRTESLMAVSYIIDHLKAEVPIWKKEIYEDSGAWKANKEWRHPMDIQNRTLAQNIENLESEYKDREKVDDIGPSLNR
ncbi:unnamed protein product [Blepharisma stoltei]|uniref:Molybdopterin synthase catalytic subunit n=1 Tax=Blepharisma stoltei TaxID=1481888 RepID=A0AAU9JUT3_9CILI|nr:unnamed protein product [Blepharisma stoltei]